MTKPVFKYEYSMKDSLKATFLGCFVSPWTCVFSWCILNVLSSDLQSSSEIPPWGTLTLCFPGFKKCFFSATLFEAWNRITKMKIIAMFTFRYSWMSPNNSLNWFSFPTWESNRKELGAMQGTESIQMEGTFSEGNHV